MNGKIKLNVMRKSTRFRSSWHWLLDGNTTMYIMFRETRIVYNDLTIEIVVHFDVIWCHIPFVALYFFLYSKSNKMTSHIRSLTLELAEDIGFVYRIHCFCWICPIKHPKDICHYNLEGKINRVFSFERTTRKHKNFEHYSHLSQTTSFWKRICLAVFDLLISVP